MKKYYKYALWLSLFTIVANLVEGIASTMLGFQDETLALFGFGIDSFIEVISAVGITWMILRIQREPESERSPFEVTALTDHRNQLLPVDSRVDNYRVS